MRLCRHVLIWLGLSGLSLSAPAAAGEPVDSSQRIPKGTATTPGSSPALASAGTVLAVMAEVTPRGTAVARPLATGEALHGGDRIMLRLQVDQPAYVALLGKAQSGQVSVLYPRGSDLKLEPGSIKSIPSDGAAIELDDVGGEENLYVVASKQPISREGADALQKLVASRAQDPSQVSVSESPPPDESERPPPMPIKTTDRGLRLICSGKGSALCVRSNRDGFAVARFVFEHVPLRPRGPLPTSSR